MLGIQIVANHANTIDSQVGHIIIDDHGGIPRGSTGRPFLQQGLVQGIDQVSAMIGGDVEAVRTRNRQRLPAGRIDADIAVRSVIPAFTLMEIAASVEAHALPFLKGVQGASLACEAGRLAAEEPLLAIARAVKAIIAAPRETGLMTDVDIAVHIHMQCGDPAIGQGGELCGIPVILEPPPFLVFLSPGLDQFSAIAIEDEDASIVQSEVDTITADSDRCLGGIVHPTRAP